jgi:transglutaminase-like putative cysteine protease
MSSSTFLLPRQLLLSLLSVFALVMLLHVSQLPLWMFVVSGLVFIWRINILREVWRAPQFLLKTVLLCVTTALLYVEYGQWFALEPMLTLLLLSLNLKLIELRSERDVVFFICLSYFAIACSFLFDQSVQHTLLALLAVLVTTATLLQVYSRLLPLRRVIVLASKILLQSSLLACVMMVVLPRLNPLWSVPLHSDAATVGMSDSMSPGEFNQLIQSDDLAFRVTFTEQELPREQMYWRGLVFDDFDGRRWQRSIPVSQSVLLPSVQNNADIAGTPGIPYDILLEASHQRWLYGIPQAVLAPREAPFIYTEQYEVLQKLPVNQRMRYSAVSYLNGFLPQPALSPSDYRRYTALPLQRNHKTREQAQLWRREAPDTEAYIARVLRYYRESFTYTLSPPALGVDTVDDFLFSTLQGFCEHFSSSFVVLMRNVGIPSRVVVGYQGGEWDTSHTYVTVYQRDAHAWAEVWFEGKGWLRIDPTSAVAEARTEQGVVAALPQEERSLVGRSTSSLAWLRHVKLQWDIVDYRWQRWVLSYDTEKQQSLLIKYFGALTPFTMLLLIFIPLSVVIVVICVSLFGFSGNALDKEKKLFLILQKRLQGLGVEYQVGDTVSKYCQRAVKKHPALSSVMFIIQNEFENIFYNRDFSDEKKRRHSLRVIKRQIKNIPS